MIFIPSTLAILLVLGNETALLRLRLEHTGTCSALRPRFTRASPPPQQLCLYYLIYIILHSAFCASALALNRLQLLILPSDPRRIFETPNVSATPTPTLMGTQALAVPPRSRYARASPKIISRTCAIAGWGNLGNSPHRVDVCPSLRSGRRRVDDMSSLAWVAWGDLGGMGYF